MPSSSSTHQAIDGRQPEINSRTIHDEPEQFRTSFDHRNESHDSVTAVLGSDPNMTPLLPSTSSIKTNTKQL